MGVNIEGVCLYEQGKQRNVKKVLARDVVRFSSISIEGKKLRCIDEETLEIKHERLSKKSPPYSAPVIRFYTDDGYQIEVTEDCEFYTPAGWIKAKDLKVGDEIYTNGDGPDLRYQDKDTLERWYVKEGKSQKEIAKMCGCAPRTIRAWVARFELGRGDSGALYGVENPRYLGENTERKGGYERTHAIHKKTGVCSKCKKVGNTHLHHLDRNPNNTSADNIMEVCVMCHRAEHLGYTVRHVKMSIIEEAIGAGNMKVVDIDTEAGNIIVEGFVIRNAGRQDGNVGK
jgi:hypothetical protein